MNDLEANSNRQPPTSVAPRWSFDQDQQHLIARLESFTDVIFGFAIFTMAMNLKVPEKASDLIEQRFEFFFFFCNFVFIALLWWQHHRIFANFFTPTILAVVLHFAFLGCTAVLSYPLQLYMQNHQSLVVIQTYLLGFAVVYFLQTSLALLGFMRLRANLTQERKLRGKVFTAISASLGLVALLSFAMTLWIGPAGAVCMCLTPIFIFSARKLARRWRNSTSPPNVQNIENPEIKAFTQKAGPE